MTKQMSRAEKEKIFRFGIHEKIEDLLTNEVLEFAFKTLQEQDELRKNSVIGAYPIGFDWEWVERGNYKDKRILSVDFQIMSTWAPEHFPFRTSKARVWIYGEGVSGRVSILNGSYCKTIDEAMEDMQEVKTRFQTSS
jgi:predicted RNase H-like HicB family nuclease|tara:strand:- start:1394 stop:1807 length:414 start_codon:yes stop_codon:yes gene_type:complete